MESIKYTVADVFTQKALSGNPVAVFTDARTIDPVDMQKIARELNLSETTFILPPKSGGDAHVRIFTPVNELPFAGHPTLGTAFVLGEMLQKNDLILETAMGNIPFLLNRLADGKIQSAEMEQPVPTWWEYEYAETVCEALGLSSSILPIEIYRNGPRHVFFGLPSIEELSSLKPDLRILATLEDVAVNCFAGAGSNWRIRMFSPAYGVAEDAATGSAAGPLALHLARHGLAVFNKWIEIQQGVEMGRCSLMRAKVTETASEIRSIKVAGSCVVVARGEFFNWY
jgi:trans-2,3-dihydro-3-hydroxyanthranilate isomerase